MALGTETVVCVCASRAGDSCELCVYRGSETVARVQREQQLSVEKARELCVCVPKRACFVYTERGSCAGVYG